MGFQSCGSPNFENFETFNLGVPEQNDIWVLAPWPSIKNIIKGKIFLLSLGCGESCEYVFACGSSVQQKCSNYTRTNLFFDLCRSVTRSEAPS
jgi:hypothetical protein